MIGQRCLWQRCCSLAAVCFIAVRRRVRVTTCELTESTQSTSRFVGACFSISQVYFQKCVVKSVFSKKYPQKCVFQNCGQPNIPKICLFLVAVLACQQCDYLIPQLPELPELHIMRTTSTTLTFNPIYLKLCLFFGGRFSTSRVPCTNTASPE